MLIVEVWGYHDGREDDLVLDLAFGGDPRDLHLQVMAPLLQSHTRLASDPRTHLGVEGRAAVDS
jgi:hypothetical protein